MGRAEFKLTIPKDGKADDYLIVLEYASPYDAALWPLTGLKHEVAVLGPGAHTLPTRSPGERLYFQPAPDTPSALPIQSKSKRAMGVELLDGRD